MDTKKTKYVMNYKPASSDTVVLENGRVLDVINGKYLEGNPSILLKNGKIDGIIGKNNATNKLLPGDFSIDLNGRTVMPAIFNTHCHVTMSSPSMVFDIKDIKTIKKFKDKQLDKNMEDCVAHGITNIRDAYTEDIREREAIISRISSNKIYGPRIIKSIVVGPPGSYQAEKYGFFTKIMRKMIGLPTLDHDHPASGISEFPPNATESQVRDAVNRAIDERGAQCIKVGEQLENMTNFKPTAKIMTIKQLAALADQARKRGITSTMHHVSVQSFRRAIRAGISSLAHMPFDEELTISDVNDFIGSDCIIEPTLTSAYSLSWPIRNNPISDSHGMKILSDYRDNYDFGKLGREFFVQPLRHIVNESMNKLSSQKFNMMKFINLKRFFQYYASVVTFAFHNFSMLFRHGAVMGSGNDGGVPPCTPAMIGNELRLFDLIIKYYTDMAGLSGKDAVKIATINSAKALGLDDAYGSIDIGKTADLIILNGDPLADSSLVGSRCDALFISGKLVIDNCNLVIK